MLHERRLKRFKDDLKLRVQKLDWYLKSNNLNEWLDQRNQESKKVHPSTQMVEEEKIHIPQKVTRARIQIVQK